MIRNYQLSRPLLALALCLAAAPPVAGALFIVDTTTPDAGDLVPGDGKCEWATIVPAGQRCTLRAAVQEANALAGVDVIVIPDGWRVVLSRAGTGEDLASLGDLDILEDVIIGSFAPHGAWPTIDGNQLDRVFDVHWPHELTLAAIEITGGSTSQDGGAVLVRGSLDASNCRIHHNSAAQYGGAVSVEPSADVTIDACTVDWNRAGFGATAFWNVGELSIYNSSVSENRDLVPGNGRPVFDNRGFLELRNTIVANNQNLAIISLDDGQAPHSLVLRNVSLVGNGSGLQFVDPDSFSSPAVHNSIIAHNPGGDCFITAGAAFVQNNNNLDSDGSCGLDALGSDLPNTDPMLGALGSHGGTTATMVPLVGSPVIDAGKNATCEPADQRAALRPLDGDGTAGAVCDIGAVEVLPCDSGAPPNGTISNLIVSPPGAVGIACFAIDVGPAVDVLNGALLGLAARDRVTFHNGFAVQSGGELEVILHHNAGSSVTVP